MHYSDLYEKGSVFVPTEVEMWEEAEAGAYLAQIVHKFPEDRIFTRDSIFPMQQVPLNRPVPEIPDAYSRGKFLDPDTWCGEYQMRAYWQSLMREGKIWRNF